MSEERKSFGQKNQSSERLFDVDTKDYVFTSLGELYKEFGEKKEYKLQGIYINSKSKFGPQPVAIIEGCLVNLPPHMLEQVKTIINDPEQVEDINKGTAGFTIYSYKNKKFGNDCYSVNFIDIKK